MHRLHQNLNTNFVLRLSKMVSPLLLSVFVCTFFLLTFQCQSTSSDKIASCSSDINYNEKVNVSLYYESLCPDSAQFIEKDLSEVLYDQKYNLTSIVNLRLVPWGNAHLSKTKQEFVCQHGADECYLNTIHACAIDVYSEKARFFFISCLEHEAMSRPNLDMEELWHSCCKILNLDPQPIDYCYSSGKGKTLELKYAEETKNLNPPHQYVPWILLDDQHINDYEHLAYDICKAYKGREAPIYCHLPPSFIQTLPPPDGKIGSNQRVCPARNFQRAEPVKLN